MFLGVNKSLDSNLVSIGKIVGTFGYRGQVRVLPLTDFPARFKDLKEIRLCFGDKIKILTVEETKPHNDIFLIKLESIDSKESAQEYKNALLRVTEDEIYPLPEGYYYHFQLKNIDVYDKKLGFLGKLVDILETGANDVYVIKSEEYGEILIPAIKQVIKNIDIKTNKMLVELLEGLIDI